jgi:hypothetical protein
MGRSLANPLSLLAQVHMLASAPKRFVIVDVIPLPTSRRLDVLNILQIRMTC